MLAQALADGPCAAAIVQPLGQYMENMCAPWSAPAVRAGVLAYPVPVEAALPWVAIDDVAERIADALDGREEGDLPICGPEMLTGDQAAAALATALGRPVRYQQITPAEFGDMVRAAAGDAFGDGIGELYAAMLSAGPPPAPDPERLRIGPTALADWARRQDWGEALAA